MVSKKKESQEIEKNKPNLDYEKYFLVKGGGKDGCGIA